MVFLAFKSGVNRGVSNETLCILATSSLCSDGYTMKLFISTVIVSMVDGWPFVKTTQLGPQTGQFKISSNQRDLVR